MKKKIKKTVNKKSLRITNEMPDFKNLALLVIALIVVVFAALFVARLGKDNTSQKESDQTIKKSASTEDNVIVPKNLSQCLKSFYEKTGNIYKIDATEYTKEDICQYYKTVKGDVEKIHNLQYNNEVVACRFFKENGQTTIGETTYIHLGYEKKACTQGMYQK
ncbi:MAG: hypothetical protein NT052_00480 [Candidatus Shapirobacteria bacterium]|nr:hypothetical protein [Candidatus Shapirobacteria bacterium]